MGVILGWIAAAATSPVVSRLIVPILSSALASFLERAAARLETKSAIKAAKVAKTSEDLRDASRKLSDASNRTP